MSSWYQLTDQALSLINQKIDFQEEIEDELKLEICGYLGPICVPFPTDTPNQKGNDSLIMTHKL